MLDLGRYDHGHSVSGAKGPHLFAVPLGCDFVAALARGVLKRTAHFQPHEIARVRIFVNTARMKRRLLEIFDQGPARILPSINLVTQLADDPALFDLPQAAPSLRQRFEIAQFIQALLEKEPDLAPRAALFDLSNSLARLMDEMHGEGVSLEALSGLDLQDQSGHWERALQFVSIIAPYFQQGQHNLSQQARQRLVAQTLHDLWTKEPPRDPIILAGSTGSRGATALLMRKIACLPQGAVVLPGFDFDMPEPVWAQMQLHKQGEDHPQFRYARLMFELEMSPAHVSPWSDDQPSHPKRNAVMSLALRPAPVTSQWLEDGPKLHDLPSCVEDMTLFEAETPREEADTIALRMRKALDEGLKAALISPDRMLTRQVTAALGRWGLVPDDSAGVPLAQSPIGRFLRHVLELMSQEFSAHSVLALLKHPLCHVQADRGAHLLRVRIWELYVRENGLVSPEFQDVLEWSEACLEPEAREALQPWLAWLAPLFEAAKSGRQSGGKTQSLAAHMAQLMTLAEHVSLGAVPKSGSLQMWSGAAGREAQKLCSDVQEHAEVLSELSMFDFSAIFTSILSQGVVRQVDEPHPQLLIWGTLEARVQGADLVILGGLNEGVWPETPELDPWLNRSMRSKLGLLLPERKTGLSAHDFQQAVSNGHVWLTRSKRSSDAQTVPSRWLNRLCNLLQGLPEQGGAEALSQMRERSAIWQAQALKLAQPEEAVPPYGRPSPCPPLEARPKRISVTQLKTLIRDPYAIYAQKVLRLKPVEPLVPEAHASRRGVIIHRILERFILKRLDAQSEEAKVALWEIACEEFTQACPWPHVREGWLLLFERNMDVFLAQEAQRQELGTVAALESWGELALPHHSVTIVCKADRFDHTPNGEIYVYDYKTGVLPSLKEQLAFDKQLLATAVMVERGAFDKLVAAPVAGAQFLGVGAQIKTVKAPLEDAPTLQVWQDLQTHFDHWAVLQHGYSARRAMQKHNDVSLFDHLSRFGEWKVTDDPVREVLR